MTPSLRVLTTPLTIRDEDVARFLPWEWTVVTASDLAAALSRPDLRSFDVLLLDLTGTETPDLECVAATVVAFGHRPVIAITDREDNDQIRTVVAAGAEDHLDRNRITSNALERILRTAVERDRLRRERDVALQEARESETRFRALADQADDIVFRYAQRPTCHLEYINPAVERVLGATVAEFYADDGLLRSRCHPDDLAAFTQRLTEPGEPGTASQDTFRFFDGAGNQIWLEFRTTGERGEDGEVVAVHGIVRDVTDRERNHQALSDALLREQENVELLRTQKLESLGRLAAGVAHELNTPIQFVSDNTRFIRDAFVELGPLFGACRAVNGDGTIDGLRTAMSAVDLDFLADEIPAALDEALTGLQHMAKLVSAMKDFAHPGTQQKTAEDLNRIVETIVTVTRNEYKYVAHLDFRPQPQLPPVLCHADQIGQSVLNLIVNAAQAIAESGQGNGRIVVSTSATDDTVQLRVADSGPGIPPDVLERVFDPFFTTKDVGEGTGQGLAIARSVVVDRHGGTLEIERTGPEGSTFLMCLPLTEGSVPC